MAVTSPSVSNFSIGSTYVIGADPTPYLKSGPSTGSASKRLSWSGIPAGSSLSSATLTHTKSGDGGSASVNNTARADSMNFTSAVASMWGYGYIDLTFKFMCTPNVVLPARTVTETAYFNNVVLTIYYTPPTAASLWGVVIDGSGATQYRGAGAAMTLSWSAANGTNNNISSYSIWYNDDGAGWVPYATGVGSASYTVYGHPTAGHNRQFLLQAIAPYGSSSQIASPAVYSYSAVGTPTNVAISPATCFPDAEVTLSWTAPGGGVGTSVTGYDVYENGVVKTGVTGTSYAFTAPAQGSYTYTVVAKANVSGYDSAASAGAALTVEPPASSFTLNKATVEMNGSATITATITPVNPAYNHDVTFALDATRTSTANVAAGSTTRTFTVPLNWCVGVPNGTSATATCTVVSKNGTTVIGQTAVTFTVTVPASVVPTVSLTVAPVNGFNGLYLKGKSSCTLTATGAGVQGSTIASRALSGGGYAGTASPFTTGILNTEGTNAMTAIVTDTRSRQATATTNITVTNYDAPVISGVLAYRTNSGGTALPTGEYIRVIANLVVSAVSGNSGTATVKKRVAGGTWGTPVAITHNTAVILSGALQENAYEVMITLTDTVGTVSTYTTTVRKATFMYDFRNDRAALGQLAGDTKTFTVPDDWTTNLNAAKLEGKTAQQVSFGSWASFDVVGDDLVMTVPDGYAGPTFTINASGELVANFSGSDVNLGRVRDACPYGIGDILQTTNATSPATRWPGTTWTALQDRVLIGAGNTYASGATGGATTHTLSSTEMPSHYHLVAGYIITAGGGNYVSGGASYSAGSWGIQTGYTGGGGAHNNMPPYRAMYMWERTA